jgi:hypothetical protein
MGTGKAGVQVSDLAEYQIAGARFGHARLFSTWETRNGEQTYSQGVVIRRNSSLMM